MEQYKRDFIGYLFETGALKVVGDFSLKSKRLSPWFVNIGDFNDGTSTGRLGQFYADAILNSGLEPDSLYGIPEKGIALVVTTAIAMASKGKNVPWFFTRKVPKEYGEVTSLSQAERIKALVVGRAPKDGESIIQLDDVFTTGDTKYEARTTLQSLGDFKLPLLVIGVDRQEVGIDGQSAIAEYEQKTGTRVIAVVTAKDVYDFLREAKANEIAVQRLANYLRVYGTQAVQEAVGKLQSQAIIERDRSVIPACDVTTIEDFEKIIEQTAEVEGIGGYKVGMELGLGYGLKRVVATAKKYTDKPIIYDHQKAGTDIPDTGKNFARVCAEADVDAIIIFPQSGPETERAWIYHALERNLEIIIGGRMTHPAYTQSEGGWITDEGALEMYRIAARIGVNNFVVPGNKPEVIQTVKEIVESEGVEPVFWPPGFVVQGGKIEDAAKVAGNRWHAIVGRGIYAAEDMRKAAVEYTSQL